MLNKRPGDKQSVWHDGIAVPIDRSGSMAGRDIVYLIAVFAMAMEGDGTFKAL